MLDELKAAELLRSIGAIQEGHFIDKRTQGHAYERFVRHALFADPDLTTVLCREIAKRHSEFDVNTVIGPENSGIDLVKFVAMHMTKMNRRKIMAAYAERDRYGTFYVPPYFTRHVIGKRVLIVDDELVTGIAVRKVAEVCIHFQASVLGVGAVWNSGGVAPQDVGVPAINALINSDIKPVGPPCELCGKVPIGHET